MKRQLRLLKTAVLFGIAGLVLLFFSIGCASSTLGTSLNVGVVATSAADYVQTRQALQRGGVEANPLQGQNAWQQAAIKAAGTSVVIGAAALFDLKGKPVLGHIVRLSWMAVYTAAAMHNAGVGR